MHVYDGTLEIAFVGGARLLGGPPLSLEGMTLGQRHFLSAGFAKVARDPVRPPHFRCTVPAGQEP